MKKIKLLLADNEEVFQQGLARLLKEYPHIEVIGLCKGPEEACNDARVSKPDIVLLGSQMDVGEVERAVSQIIASWPRARVVMIARPEEQVNKLITALKAGARACLARSITLEDLVKCFDLIATGRIVISPLFADAFVGELSKAKDEQSVSQSDRLVKLSARELEVVGLLIGGASSKEIAEKLMVSVNTANVHVKNIFKKLDLRNRRQLVAYAVIRGLREPAE